MPDDLLMTHLAGEIGFLEDFGWNSVVFKEQVAFQCAVRRRSSRQRLPKPGINGTNGSLRNIRYRGYRTSKISAVRNARTNQNAAFAAQGAEGARE
jgi:hypothetical protein